MASAYIDISSTATNHSAELYGFIDYAALAGHLGLSEADATSIYNLIGSVNGELHGAFTAQLLARAG